MNITHFEKVSINQFIKDCKNNNLKRLFIIKLS